MTEKKEIILVIDDEEPVRELISDTLSSGNYSVLSSGNAGGALELLAMNWVDLVLCDIQLPDRSGIDLSKQIRRKHPDLPIVMVTGSADANAAIDALKLGAADYITKPFDVNQLLSCVQLVLSRENERRAILAKQEEEKRSLRALFERCVSPLVVEQLINTPEQLRLRGERRVATVLFGDVRGFTAASGEIDPVERIGVLKALRPISRQPVSARNVTVLAVTKTKRPLSGFRC